MEKNVSKVLPSGLAIVSFGQGVQTKSDISYDWFAGHIVWNLENGCNDSMGHWNAVTL